MAMIAMSSNYFCITVYMLVYFFYIGLYTLIIANKEFFLHNQNISFISSPKVAVYRRSILKTGALNNFAHSQESICTGDSFSAKLQASTLQLYLKSDSGTAANLAILPRTPFLQNTSGQQLPIVFIDIDMFLRMLVYRSRK